MSCVARSCNGFGTMTTVSRSSTSARSAGRRPTWRRPTGSSPARSAGSQSLLLTRDYFRYVLPARNPAGKELIYVPYWRFKGMLLFSLPAGVEYKFIDVSHCATDAPGASR
ncbi:MAG: hypothetical protein MZV70_51600 [Desulfobacterales bacterium]|nr:hypothetical protein [Desulfobacterales bacterium]